MPTKKKCGYCGKSEDGLIRGKTATQLICINCVKNFGNLVHSNTRNEEPVFGEPPTPRNIVTFLDEYVIGQSAAKKVLSVAVYNHYKRLLSPQFDQDATEIEKSNVLMLGSTGCGKTLLAKTLARMLNVPFAIGDATTLTEAGYVGEDVENLLLKLLHAADMNLPLAERGIIYIDEIDKISRATSNVSITRDVSGEGVQQSLLKMLEGTVCNVPPGGGRKHPDQKYITMNTKNILFICGGTFVGIEDIIAKRTNKKTIGFGASVNKEDTDVLAKVTSEDLVQFGIIPELIGRLPVITPLNELNEAEMMQVLIEPKNALIRQYQKMFRMEGSQLEFTEEALVEVVKLARLQKTGARSLRGVLEQVMLDIMFDLPEHLPAEYVITKKIVTGEEKLFMRKEAA